jgi:diguanylate cyclase (GGDEF)-like protein
MTLISEDLAGVLLCAGGAACLGAAVSRRRAPPLLLAFGLLAAGVAEFSAEGDPAPVVAVAITAAGVLGLVLERFERIPRLSWFDAIMGATATGALVSALGGGAALAVALSGVAGAFALSRWQLAPSMVLAAAGLVVLGVTPELAWVAAPLVALAAWRREPRVGEGPEFRWTVLASLIVFATGALTLLALGQFMALSDAAGALAIGTVVAGMTRAAVTVTARLRESMHRALTDDLTGLGNRRQLLDRLDAAIDRGGGLALLLIDLDGFKELNDTLGHHAGDEVLRQIGPRLNDAVREHDTMARLGGDEFALVLWPGDEAGASAAALRVRSALERSFSVERINVHIDASVGIALCPDHALSALGLLQRADVAMYQAKRRRTGHEVYLPARDRHSRERLALVGELHSAIEARELLLHYQPKVHMASGSVRGVEALVRWQHPRRGLLAPRHFLPLAEQSGLSRMLTAYAVDRALDEIGRCRRAGLELTVAVNLGPADLLDLGLPSEIALALERRRFAPDQVTLEVSEDVIMTDPERTFGVLAGLDALGVDLSLDDFGAGRSSLSHLKGLPLSELKIDRSFVLDLPTDHADAAIARSAVELGGRLGLRVVAEGVTSLETCEMLAGWGCDEGQGFYLGTPMPAEELAGWLERRRLPSDGGSAATGGSAT